MKRIRVAGLVEMENGYALMHRMNVKKKENSNAPYGEYYVFPGGGVEGEESLEEGVRREVLEEFGIEVEVKQKLYFRQIGEELELPIPLTTYVARHSQATVMKKAGVATSVIREIMGHSSERVTQIYLDSFDNEQIDNAMKNLL